MALPMTTAQTRAAFQKWGVPFKEYSGWGTRKRPGAFAPVGLVIHHTGSDSGQNSSNYDRFLFVDGRSGIPGPLCQAACEMDGDVLLGAIGRANHAGKGAANTRAFVGGDNAPMDREISPGPDELDGNALYYGIEVKYDGGQPMTPKQYRSTLLWAAAICDHYGWTAGSVIGHREHSRRKPDPGNCPMDQFRRDLAALLKAGPAGKASSPTRPTPTKPDVPTEDEMTPEEFLNSKVTAKMPDGSTKDFGTLRGVLATLVLRTADDDSRASRIEAKLDAVLKANTGTGA